MIWDSMSVQARDAESTGTMAGAVAIAYRVNRQPAPLSKVVASSGFVGEALNATLHQFLAHVKS